MAHLEPTPGGTVVAFRSTGSKSRRAAVPSGTERGAILLFTGIRYDRMHQDRPHAETARPGEYAPATEPVRAGEPD